MPAPEADFATFAADLPAFAAALAAIHAIDWRAVGLDFLAYRVRPPKIQGRGRSRCAAHVGVRLRRRALTALLASTPSGGRLALCHGDPNPFNYLFRGQQVVGVVDWEQAPISDPRSDIGQLVSLSHLRGAAPYGPPSENPFVQCTRHPPARGSRAWSCSGRAGFSSSASCTTAGRPTERNRGSPGRRSRTSLPALSRSCDVAARTGRGDYPTVTVIPPGRFHYPR